MKQSRATLGAEFAQKNESSDEWSRLVAPRELPVRLPKASDQNDSVKTSKYQEASVHSNKQVEASTLSFLNISQFGDLFVRFLRARKETFIDRLQWNLPEANGMEFDQYDTAYAKWIVIHEFGVVLAGVRLVPTTAKCGIYTYMLRDAQKGILENIPSDVLFFDAPIDPNIWEASRLFIAEDVQSERRSEIQRILMAQMASSARELGALHVIGIVPSVWSRWLRRLEFSAVPIGPKFSIDGTETQAALFNVNQ